MWRFDWENAVTMGSLVLLVRFRLISIDFTQTHLIFFESVQDLSSDHFSEPVLKLSFDLGRLSRTTDRKTSEKVDCLLMGHSGGGGLQISRE